MSEGFLRHIRLDTSERSRLLCRLDERPGSTPGRDRRRWKRWEYRVSDIAVIVQHPGGGTGRFLVCARNISNGGISFIHGGYLHPGSECRVLLPKRDGRPLAVAGVVVHCRHLDGSHHEIGIQFMQQVDATEVLPSWDSPDEKEADEKAIELPTLSGRVLVVDQSSLDRRLLAHRLSVTGLTMTMVETPGAAIDAVRRQQPEIVLCELNLDSDAVRMIQQMRKVGFQGPILVVTAEHDVSRLMKAREAGANEIVGKPYDPAYLASLLAEWLEAPAVERPVYSTFEDDPGMSEMIADFIHQTRLNGQRLEKALEDGEMSNAREVVLALMGSGSGYGFLPLTEAARDALTALDTSGNQTDASPALRRLIGLTQRLRTDASGRSIDGWGRTVA